jgi:hypothetical protein
MSKLVPVPVQVKMELEGRVCGKFNIFPEAIQSHSGLEIKSWKVEHEGSTNDLYDVLLISLLPRSLTFEVCKRTFEELEDPGNPDSPSATVNFTITIDDESWSWRMRAVEQENETVHYQIDIEGEWMDMINTFVGDIIGEEQFPFAERAVLPQIDFGNRDTVLEQMS